MTDKEARDLTVSLIDYIEIRFREHEKLDTAYRDATNQALQEAKRTVGREKESSRYLTATILSILALLGTLVAIILVILN
jgi:hypothetical protein